MSDESRDRRIDYVEFPAQSADEFAAAKQFYHDAFGWEFKDWGDEYSDTHDSGVTTGFSCSATDRPAGPVVVLYATDLEATLGRVTAAGGKVVREIFSFPGGRRFEYIDPAGNRLGVWSDR